MDSTRSDAQHLAGYISCEVKQEKAAKTCHGIVDQAVVPENYRRKLRIDRVSTLKCGGKVLNDYCRGKGFDAFVTESDMSSTMSWQEDDFGGRYFYRIRGCS